MLIMVLAMGGNPKPGVFNAILWTETDLDAKPLPKITYEKFKELAVKCKEPKCFHIITANYGCVECDVLERIMDETDAWVLVGIQLIVTKDKESLKEAEKIPYIHVPIILDCYKKKSFEECEWNVEYDPTQQFNKWVEKLAEYGLVEIEGEAEL